MVLSLDDPTLEGQADGLLRPVDALSRLPARRTEAGTRIATAWTGWPEDGLSQALHTGLVAGIANPTLNNIVVAARLDFSANAALTSHTASDATADGRSVLHLPLGASDPIDADIRLPIVIAGLKTVAHGALGDWCIHLCRLREVRVMHQLEDQLIKRYFSLMVGAREPDQLPIQVHGVVSGFAVVDDLFSIHGSAALSALGGLLGGLSFRYVIHLIGKTHGQKKSIDRLTENLRSADALAMLIA